MWRPGLGSAAALGVALFAGCVPLDEELDGSVGGGNVYEDPDSGAIDEPEGPELYTIDLVSVLVGPLNPLGESWDGDSDVEEATVRFGFMVAGLPCPYDLPGAKEQLDTLFAAGYHPPDPRGTAVMDFGLGFDELTRISLESDQGTDNYFVTWSGEPQILGVPIGSETVLSIELWDEDFWEDDSIGRLIIGADKLLEIYEAGKAGPVLNQPLYVGDQDPNTIVFVELAVREYVPEEDNW